MVVSSPCSGRPKARLCPYAQVFARALRRMRSVIRFRSFTPPQEPANAILDSFVQNWFLTLLFGGIGLVFLMVGGALVWTITLGPKRAEQRLSQLKRTGRSVQAQVMAVEPNASVTLNGSNPWRIVAQWLNPETGKVQLFYNQNLWFDPSPYVTMKELQVWLDPQRPKHYSLDTDFLPKMA
ncbi:unnamed protein product, partial [Mesorhabditis spiculigera]